MMLSVLIPTTPDRAPMFQQLWKELNEQAWACYKKHESLGNVEILFDDSKSFLNGGLSIGKKRQSLVTLASCKYVCFCDSDDTISPNYVESLLRLCQHNADVVTFRNFTKTDYYWTLVDMSLKYLINDEANPNFITRRRPWTICPIRSSIAKSVNFPDINYGEDAAWIEDVLKQCTTEAHTEQILHCYQHSSKHSEADKITRKELEDHTSKITKDQLEYFTIHGKFK